MKEVMGKPGTSAVRIACTSAAFALALMAAPASAQDGEIFDVGLKAVQEGNFAEGYCYWKKLADNGDPEASYSIGWMYANGLGVNVNVPEAIKWWQAAASKGHLSAKFAIGLAYLNGDGVKQNDEKAVKWILEAAANGYEDAQDVIRQLVLQGNETVLLHLQELVSRPWFTETVTVNKDGVNLRGGPSTSDKKLARLTVGEKLPAIGRNGDWIAVVQKDGSLAWIYARLVDIPPE